MIKILASTLAMMSIFTESHTHPIHELNHIEVGEGNYMQTLIHGKDSSLPLLLIIIGGKGTPSITFEPFTRRLSETYVYMIYTMRGVMGLNSTSSHIDIQGHIDDAKFMSHYLSSRFNHRPLTVSGISYGADLALQVAAQVPDLVNHVVCISGFFDVPRNLQIFESHLAERVPAPLVLLSKLLGDKNAVGYIFKLYLAGMYGLIAYECKDSYPCWPSILIGPRSVLDNDLIYDWWYGLKTVVEMTRISKSFETILTLKPPTTLTMPVTFMVGKFDLMANRVCMDEYVSTMSAPYSTIVVFNSSTHFLILEENDRFIHEMEFIAHSVSCASIE